MARWYVYFRKIVHRRDEPPQKATVNLVDSNDDGLISREELEASLRQVGLGWVRIRAWFAVRSADKNGDGFIDASEMNALADYARQHWHINLIVSPEPLAAA